MSERVKNPIAEKLKTYREQSQLTQAQVARKLDCTMKIKTYQSYEEGRARLPVKLLPAFAALIGVDLMELLNEFK